MSGSAVATMPTLFPAATRRRGIRSWIAAGALLTAGVAPGAFGAPAALAITEQQALAAGKRLWNNECGGTVAGLTSWNAGEDFASLGIGHFIWYHAGKRGPFEESFPELVRFLVASGVRVPEWLATAPACPWDSRTAFLAAKDDPRQVQLRELLAGTVGAQARFCADRLESSLPKMLATAPTADRERIRQQFYTVAASPNGVYALVDYVNFKGEGVLATERYQGQGWGLLQVLAGMNTQPGTPGRAAMEGFAASASRVLTERVANAPPARGESRWLPGWKNRVQTYPSGT